MNAPLQRIGVRWRMFLEGLVFALALVLGSVSLADIMQNYSCLPTTIPVMSCVCPQGPASEDRCWGNKPKLGNCYGEVWCNPVAGQQCDWRPNRDANECGHVYKCTGAPCTAICVPGECLGFKNKPKCAGRWGYCVTPEPEL